VRRKTKSSDRNVECRRERRNVQSNIQCPSSEGRGRVSEALKGRCLLAQGIALGWGHPLESTLKGCRMAGCKMQDARCRSREAAQGYSPTCWRSQSRKAGWGNGQHIAQRRRRACPAGEEVWERGPALLSQTLSPTTQGRGGHFAATRQLTFASLQSQVTSCQSPVNNRESLSPEPEMRNAARLRGVYDFIRRLRLTSYVSRFTSPVHSLR
jgi:hypothetical protein